MKIPFHNLGQQPKHISVNLKEETFDVSLEGDLQKTRQDTVLLKGELKGTVKLECDGCAEIYTHHLDEKVSLKITNRPLQTGGNADDEQDYDIIEFLDGIIDVNEIILSEVNTLKYDYHKCTNCN